jgi:hypothetical protein
MCFGGGPSAKSIYQEKKPKFGALPSLAMTKTKRDPQQLKDVPTQRTGMKKRSLLFYGDTDATG